MTLGQWQRKIKIGYIICLLACTIALPLGLAADQGKNPVQKQNKAPVKQTVAVAKKTVAAKPSKTTVPGHIWNLQNADIKSVIVEIAKETGKNFLVDPRVTGQVNLISTKPLPPKALYPVFLAMLQTYGYAAIPEKNVIKIVPNINASQSGPPLASHGRPGKGDAVVVRVITVNNVSATQLVPVLRPLLPQWATIAAYPPANMLILSGAANNLQHISDIVKTN